MPHGKKHGLYENIRLKKARIARGSKEKMRKPGALELRLPRILETQKRLRKRNERTTRKIWQQW